MLKILPIVIWQFSLATQANFIPEFSQMIVDIAYASWR
jgi:hypothetical protein